MAEAVLRNNEDKVSNAEIMRKALHLGGTLFAVTAVTGLILGFVQWGTDYAIKNAELAAKNEALRNVMPAATSFETVEVVPDEFVSDVQRGMNGPDLAGYCLSVNSQGYGGTVGFVVGITKDGTVKAINILSHSETPGLGAKSTEPEFYEQFNDRAKLPLKVVKGAATEPDEISAISGATITSTAVTTGVNAAVDYWARNLKEK